VLCPAPKQCRQAAALRMTPANPPQCPDLLRTATDGGSCLKCPRDHPPVRNICADAPLLVSVQQKDTNNRMALQFVQYLDRRTRFAQLGREATSILFSNATLRDQGRYSNRS
jgi:hypothetical protein